MSPMHTTKQEVFKRILDLLRKGLPDYANRIYLVAGQDMPDNVRDKDFLVVRAGGGQFNRRIMEASGPVVVPYEGSCTVEVWKNNRQDRNGTSEHILLSDQAGLFEVEQAILSCMSGTYLASVDKPFEGLLTTAMFPLDDSEPQRQQDEVWEENGNKTASRAVLGITFNVAFMWQL